jgi:hypothetical protein
MGHVHGDKVGLDAYDAGFQAPEANGGVFLSIVMQTYNKGPTIRRAVSQLLSTSSAVTDMHTCLKLLPLGLVRGMRLVELGFGLDTEITANVLKIGYRPLEVPSAYYVRSHRQGKKINWRDGLQFLRILARVRLANLLEEKEYRTGSCTSDGPRSLIDAMPSNAD